MSDPPPVSGLSSASLYGADLSGAGLPGSDWSGGSLPSVGLLGMEKFNLASLVNLHDRTKRCLVDIYGALTYGELSALAESWRQHFQAEGIKKGDRIAIITHNDRTFVAPYLGALALGAIVVPLNPHSPEPEMKHELDLVSPELILPRDVVSSPNLESGGGEGGVGGGVASGGVASDGVVGDGIASDGGVGDGIASDGVLKTLEMHRDDPCVLLFTSGTAGFPKAAILTHGSLLANLEQIRGYSRPEDVGLAVLPFFHVFGLNVVLNLGLLTGGTLIMTAMTDEVTLVAGVPAHFEMWAHDASIRMDNVRLAISGGAPLSRETATKFRERFGLPIHEGYGLTEASPVVSFPDFDKEPVFGSVGTPLKAVEVKLVDSSGEEVFEGDAGEVLVRGPNVFAGYFRSDKSVVDAQGWLHTGDIGVVGYDGNLYLVDRAKDLIIVSGFNVYPQEVEKVIEELDGVEEVAVAGKDRVNVYVVAKNITENDIIHKCRENLAAYKCPSSVYFVDSLPRSASGEVLRRSLDSRS